MNFLIISLIVLGVALLIVFATMCVCFFMTFFSVRRKAKEEFPIPPGKVYDGHKAQMVQWMREVRDMEHTDVEIKSFDGLTLRGRYYECRKGGTIEILFHGYRGNSFRDLCGGVSRCFRLGHNALIVDHRASGRSEGRVITFGAKECRDCVDWVNFAIKNIDPDARIIITGISMGAATVMMAASKELPANVVGVLADCGYTSTRDIIKKVMRDMKLPPNLLYPFARLSAIVFGGFDPDADSPIESMKKCKIPVIFFHGDVDAYVPCYMSEQNFGACASEKKRFVVTPGAGHGLCFPTDQEAYLEALREFFPY